MKAADAESPGTTPLADSQSYPRSGYTATHRLLSRGVTGPGIHLNRV
jgi:hypothetical protein